MAFRRLAVAALLAFAAVPAASAHAYPYLPPAGKVFAGVSGSITEPGVVPAFDSRTGKHAPVVQTFVSWGYTATRWLRLARAEHARAMVHITTLKGNGHEITPRAIATGHGDAPIVSLTRTFGQSGQVIYVRLMAEMNGSWNAYSAYGPGGYKGGAHSTQNFKQAWRRIVLIMRGGPVDEINAKLHALHMPSVRGASGVLPKPKVAFLWVPEVWGDPNVSGNSAAAYWPGGKYVDWVGTDFYSKFPNYRGLNAFYNEFRHKPFVFGEWAMWGSDNPGFVRGLFGWIRSHKRVRMVMYNQGSHPSQSPLALAHYPRSAAALRGELRSPLFAPTPPEFS
ncbi:MAG TPA: hypothetical protein VJU60_09125 [Thermoleophilaceae bacterium]|nr:hypothetical protein [Thermoleophilaceae bacterium]